MNSLKEINEHAESGFEFLVEEEQDQD